MKRLSLLLSSLVVLMILASVAFTQVANDFIPTMINYQGFLTDQNGATLTGNYQITFSLYDKASGADPWLWQEIHTAVTVEAGLFNVLLGSIDTLTADDLAGERYLGITVAGEVEMTPRMRLASSAYSIQAENANMLDNIDSKDFFLPRGFIGMWSGAIDSIPSGWALCDGGTYDRSDGQGTVQTPDLRDRFIVGSGLKYATSNNGGIDSVTITLDQLPSHNHGVTDPTHNHSYNDIFFSENTGSMPSGATNVTVPGQVGSGNHDNDNVGYQFSRSGGYSSTGISIQNNGGGQSVENRPKYFALAYIMKL